MKHIVLLLAALALVLVQGTADARDVKEIGKAMSKPIELHNSADRHFHTTFKHNTHREVPCHTCHHEEGSAGIYSPCSECHATSGPRQADPMSVYQAFHSKHERSCLSCHKQLLNADPVRFALFRGCRPCHISPKGQAEFQARYQASAVREDFNLKQTEAAEAEAAAQQALAIAKQKKEAAKAAEEKLTALLKQAESLKAKRLDAEKAALKAFKEEQKAVKAEAPKAEAKPAAEPKAEAKSAKSAK
ncbi:MAG: cytochrome c3 family protein [Desulfovibrio sp.]|nr:cytochrome c3 family protein [Desulfovibrio sp.]